MIDPADRPGAPLLPLTLFADFACPFSYVTEEALARISHGAFALTARAFDLGPPGGRVAAPVDADAWNRVAGLADEMGLDLSLPAVVSDTRKAHEAARYAREGGLEPRLRSALYRAYWSEGRDIGRIDVLAELGEEVGLEAEGLRIALDIDRFTPDVEHDIDVARRLRVPGTPTLFVGTGPAARVLVGARSQAELRRAIDDMISNGKDGYDEDG